MQRLLLTMVMAATLLAAAAGVLKKETPTTRGDYNFWLWQPSGAGKAPVDSDSVAAARRPLVVFLHGASLCGTNMERVRRYGPIDAVEHGRKIDAYILAPQNPGGSWKPDKVMRMVDWTRRHYPDVDSTRIYIIGMSLGGFGTLDTAAKYPHRFAAALAMCGGSTASDLGRLNEMPLWIIHGLADRAVTIGQSDRVVAAMKAACDSTPRLSYDRVPGMNHGGPARMFYLPETYDWLFRHSLSDSLRPIAPTFNVTDELLRTAYRGMTMPARKKKARKRRK